MSHEYRHNLPLVPITRCWQHLYQSFCLFYQFSAGGARTEISSSSQLDLILPFPPGKVQVGPSLELSSNIDRPPDQSRVEDLQYVGESGDGPPGLPGPDGEWDSSVLTPCVEEVWGVRSWNCKMLIYPRAELRRADHVFILENQEIRCFLSHNRITTGFDFWSWYPSYPYLWTQWRCHQEPPPVQCQQVAVCWHWNHQRMHHNT